LRWIWPPNECPPSDKFIKPTNDRGVRKAHPHVCSRHPQTIQAIIGCELSAATVTPAFHG
jgi:hypothetical protein